MGGAKMGTPQGEDRTAKLKQQLKELEEKGAKHKKAALDGDETLSPEGRSHGELAAFYIDQARTLARKIEGLK
jgi:hypothetical protein